MVCVYMVVIMCVIVCSVMWNRMLCMWCLIMCVLSVGVYGVGLNRNMI